MKLCHLYINHPEHAFDRGLKAEAESVAADLTRDGFPIRVELRYGRGDEARQRQLIEADRRAARPADLFVIIPIDQDAVYAIVSDIVTARDDATCVFLHQPLTPTMRSEREAFGQRLFSVAADQTEIGRLQARQFAALLPEQTGSVLYVQGAEHSYGTRHRMKGLLQEMPRTPGIKLNGYRVFGDWSPESVRPAVERWAQLGGKLEWIQAAGAQNDDMALALAGLVRESGVSVPVIGVDGMEAGQRAVDDGTLAATVIQPLAIGHVLRLYRELQSGVPQRGSIPEDGNIRLPPESYPPLDVLRRRAARTS